MRRLHQLVYVVILERYAKQGAAGTTACLEQRQQAVADQVNFPKNCSVSYVLDGVGVWFGKEV